MKRSVALYEHSSAYLLRRLALGRFLSDALFRILRPRGWYARPIPERHRFVFYMGHLEAFDWNLFTTTLFDAPPVHDSFEKLFARGIDPVDGGLPDDLPGDWPPVVQVQTYGRRIREALDQRLARVLDAKRERNGIPAATVLNVAIEHRLMHMETLAYMLHWLPLDQKVVQHQGLQAVAGPVAQEMTVIPEGTATLGLARENAFGWDNELPEHAVAVPAFAIQKYKVTNAEFLTFMRDGGYEERSFWTDEDWEWKEREGIRHPRFWEERSGIWLLRTMFDEIPLPDRWPVYVSHAEAAAYARWAGCRLPTEAQYHRAAYGTPAGKERSFPWGEQRPSARHGNFDMVNWNPCPVNSHPAGDSAFGVSELAGNGWEWTDTSFGPFRGFEPFPFYAGYSADFFDGRHYVLKGASPRTAACLLRRSFRNWFQGHYPYVYAGFRCISPVTEH